MIIDSVKYIAERSDTVNIRMPDTLKFLDITHDHLYENYGVIIIVLLVALIIVRLIE